MPSRRMIRADQPRMNRHTPRSNLWNPNPDASVAKIRDLTRGPGLDRATVEPAKAPRGLVQT